MLLVSYAVSLKPFLTQNQPGTSFQNVDDMLAVDNFRFMCHKGGSTNALLEVKYCWLLILIRGLLFNSVYIFLTAQSNCLLFIYILFCLHFCLHFVYILLTSQLQFCMYFAYNLLRCNIGNTGNTNM